MGKTELFAETVKHISQTIAVLVADTMYVFIGIGRELVHTYENAKLVMTGAFEEARKQNEAFEKENERRAIRMAEVQNKILGLGFDTNGSSSYDAVKTKDSTGRNVIKSKNPEEEKAERERLKLLHFNIQQRQKEGKEIEDNIRRVQEAYASESIRQDIIARTLKDQQEMFVLGLQYRHMKTEDVQLSKDLLEIEQKRNNNIRDIKLNTDLNLAAQNDLIDRENRLATEAERLARARKEMSEELRKGTFGQGFQMSMTEYFMNAKTEMETGRQAFDSVMGNMSAALDNFARTGKLSFKDLAKSIIQDLIAIQLKASAMSMFKSLGFGFSASGVDNLFKGAANYSGGKGGFAADGGDLSANDSYIVGERGPELFVPKVSGTVIPNNMLGSAMGGGGQSITYNGPYIANMSAIDTQSATQFLSRNKSAVWAANQTAQRALPQSR
jgi:lambda family phage tail tape measure protein